MQYLLKAVESLWDSSLEQKVSGWANDVNTNKKKTEDARKRFHQWEPFRVYTSVSRIKNNPSYFSLRFFGQEVAEIRVKRNGVKLKIDAKHVNWNKRYFKLTFKENEFEWDSKQAKQFRDKFKSPRVQNLKPHSPEHRVETNIINSMKKAPSKSGVPNIQPVFFADCPLQVPLPITGSSGVPKMAKGNSGGKMDILARRGVGKSAKLSVWELKRPGRSSSELIKAIKQSIIYASTLRMMLRSSSGQTWYELFGFNGRLPKNLKIEAVVTIAQKDKENFKQAKKKLQPWSPLSIGNDSILPYVACYDDNTYEVTTICPINRITRLCK